MDSSIWFDTMRLKGFIVHNKGSQVRMSKLRCTSVSKDQDVLQFSKIIFKLANSADPDEMQHFAAFILGLHCLAKYP